MRSHVAEVRNRAPPLLVEGSRQGIFRHHGGLMEFLETHTALQHVSTARVHEYDLLGLPFTKINSQSPAKPIEREAEELAGQLWEKVAAPSPCPLYGHMGVHAVEASVEGASSEPQQEIVPRFEIGCNGLTSRHLAGDRVTGQKDSYMAGTIYSAPILEASGFREAMP